MKMLLSLNGLILPTVFLAISPWSVWSTLTVISLALYVTARVQLGEAFAVGPQHNGLVTTGLYRFMRHPMYIFSTLGLLFGVVAAHIWWLLLLVAFVSYGQYVRAKAEDLVLAPYRALGDTATWV